MQIGFILATVVVGNLAFLFEEIRMKTCQEPAEDYKGQLEASFFGNCGGLLSSETIRLGRGNETSTRLRVPVEMSDLEYLTLRWSGENSNLCLSDLIITARTFKIQLLESFPRDVNGNRRAWFSSSCGNKLDRSKSKRELFDETCAQGRTFHFLRLKLDFCQSSLSSRARLPWWMSYDSLPKNMSNSFWSNVSTRWNSNADSNIWIKLLGTTTLQSTFEGISTVKFDWGENICLENVEINSTPLFASYPTWFHGKSIFELAKVNCVAPSINKQDKEKVTRKEAKRERKKAKLETFEWLEKHAEARDGGCPAPVILEQRGVLYKTANNSSDEVFQPGTKLSLSCVNGLRARPKDRLKCKCKIAFGCRWNKLPKISCDAVPGIFKNEI